jgi:predicted nucleotidyltransferase component of viral defense system
MMVEQDYLLCRAVAPIFEDDFLSMQVAMRGGTVLHKGHLAPASRYSEDIVLVLVGDRPSSYVKKVLTRVLRPVLGTPAERRQPHLDDAQLPEELACFLLSNMTTFSTEIV